MTVDRSIGPRCNIGPAEIARRRRSALAFSAVAAGAAVALLALDASAVGRLALFPFAAGAATSWMQVVHRFCVAFGALGIENLGAAGQQVAVDPEQRAMDRRRAAQLVVEGTLIGAAITLAFVALPG